LAKLPVTVTASRGELATKGESESDAASPNDGNLLRDDQLNVYEYRLKSGKKTKKA